MREPRRIGIVGLGLIGGSLALALRRAESRAQSRSARSGRVRFEIVGVDTHEKTLDDAASSGAWPCPDRDPCPLETTVPGILAAGDIRVGATKRVGFAVGDGSLAVTCVHRLLSIQN